ncbi:PREDICTED: protein FAR1-RELATED SEQUENCE 5-like [Ipomoea nil]|uniref:protein FAR1-RELATED SEQUENCE 5-like n=1 Tax=Ipomoea nil TaxID=35883 RepID=UPI0009012725|nr:PREDICTED: protein FAR1-RELATED SEQUENCE 5-like [Ipomoea nil]
MAATNNNESCVINISAGTTKYWTPKCEPTKKPFPGQVFTSLEAAIQFYQTYAKSTGFDVHRASDKRDRHGKITWKYVLCSRAGFKLPTGEGDGVGILTTDHKNTTKRRRVTNRVGCNAKIVFKRLDSDSFEVNSIEERHTHSLCTPISRPFMKANRKLDLGHQNFIINCSKANIGSCKSFTLYEEMVGGFENVGATVTDFGNFKRDIMAYIEDTDAQLVIDKYMEKKNVSPDFYFAHDVDELDQLCRIFWADPQARHNFKLFGDTMSFDATYDHGVYTKPVCIDAPCKCLMGTQLPNTLLENTSATEGYQAHVCPPGTQYKLVFVPFTGVDHHKKSVTFAAGLIA